MTGPVFCATAFFDDGFEADVGVAAILPVLIIDTNESLNFLHGFTTLWPEAGNKNSLFTRIDGDLSS